jgi:hypothetical protein
MDQRLAAYPECRKVEDSFKERYCNLIRERKARRPLPFEDPEGDAEQTPLVAELRNRASKLEPWAPYGALLVYLSTEGRLDNRHWIGKEEFRRGIDGEVGNGEFVFVGSESIIRHNGETISIEASGLDRRRTDLKLERGSGRRVRIEFAVNDRFVTRTFLTLLKEDNKDHVSATEAPKYDCLHLLLFNALQRAGSPKEESGIPKNACHGLFWLDNQGFFHVSVQKHSRPDL